MPACSTPNTIHSSMREQASRQDAGCGRVQAHGNKHRLCRLTGGQQNKPPPITAGTLEAQLIGFMHIVRALRTPSWGAGEACHCYSCPVPSQDMHMAIPSPHYMLRINHQGCCLAVGLVLVPAGCVTRVTQVSPWSHPGVTLLPHSPCKAHNVSIRHSHWRTCSRVAYSPTLSAPHEPVHAHGCATTSLQSAKTHAPKERGQVTSSLYTH